MVRSRLPPLSLLGLFGAVQMLSPELLMGKAGDYYDVSLIDSEMQEALAFAVEQFNLEYTNYFKVSNVLYLQKKMIEPDNYHLTLTVNLVKTICKKKAGRRRKYKSIQECEQLPGNHQQQNCNFEVKLCPLTHKMKFIWISCLRTGAPEDPLCSG